MTGRTVERELLSVWTSGASRCVPPSATSTGWTCGAAATGRRDGVVLHPVIVAGDGATKTVGVDVAADGERTLSKIKVGSAAVLVDAEHSRFESGAAADAVVGFRPSRAAGWPSEVESDNWAPCWRLAARVIVGGCFCCERERENERREETIESSVCVFVYLFVCLFECEK